MFSRCWLSYFGSGLITLAAAGSVWGDTSDPNSDTPATVPSKPKQRLMVTPERVAAVMTFVRLNHPELEGLLGHLKESGSKEYERAIRELYRVTEKLAQVHERDPARYELELKAWKIQSRLQLLSAKMQMNSNEELKQQIKDVLAEQHAVKTEMLSLQRKKFQEEAKRLGEDLNRLEAQKTSTIQKQFETLTRVPAAGSESSPTNKASDRKPTDSKPNNRKVEEKSKPTS